MLAGGSAARCQLALSSSRLLGVGVFVVIVFYWGLYALLMGIQAIVLFGGVFACFVFNQRKKCHEYKCCRRDCNQAIDAPCVLKCLNILNL